ncbi:MAG TPA: hypothetical protein PLS16_00845 [Chitinophagales bacterium]|nr:hypothetical protein [Chitinophagales bacterium]
MNLTQELSSELKIVLLVPGYLKQQQMMQIGAEQIVAVGLEELRLHQ